MEKKEPIVSIFASEIGSLFLKSASLTFK